MEETPPQMVEVTGALSGRYELQEQAEDGTIVLRPDTSARAIMDRLATKPVSAAQFDAAFGDLPTGDS